MRDLPTATVTFLFTDVEGSTQLIDALGADYPRLHAEHQRLLRAAWAASNGIEVSTEGDSFFVVFRLPREAAEAAGAAHRALAAHPWPAGRTFRVRIGIHTGQGVLFGDTYVGLDVNRAARITAAGHGGQTLLSESSRDALGDALPADLALTDLGRHRLKDIGVMHLFQLEVEGVASRLGPLRTLEAHPTNLPPEVAFLVDRERELAAIAQLIPDTQVVTVTGPGGIGKSRVALRVARDLVDDFVDGVFYLDVSTLDTADQVAVAMAGVLDARLPDDLPSLGAIAEHLRGRNTLIVLETAERVVGLPEMIGTLAASCPRVRFLVTSRSPLHLTAEREVPVAPLGLPPTAPRASLEAIVASPAVQLFVERARAVRPDFVLTRESALATAEICARLDGVPLAIELAAARARILPPSALLSRLDRRLPLLAGGARDAPARQRTLRDTIAWSYDLLNPAERAVLQRLAVFAGSFDLTSTEAIGGVGLARLTDAGGPDLLTTFEALLDQSLVARADSNDEVRFRLLGTIREFALEALEASGDSDEAREAHADYWLEFARSLAPALEGADDLLAVARVEREIDELRAAVEWALATRAELALALTAALGHFLWLRSHLRVGLDWLERALTGAPSGDVALRAQAAYWAGILHDSVGEFDSARGRLEEAARLYARLGDARGEARTLNSLGVVFRSLGDLDGAEGLLRDSLARKRSLGDERGIATTLTNLGIVEVDRLRFESARPLFEEAVALDLAAGAQGGAAYSRLGLAAVLLDAGDVSAAEAEARSSLSTFGELEDAEGVAGCLDALSSQAVAQSDGMRALRLSMAAAVIRRREGIPVRELERVTLAKTEAAAVALVDSTHLPALRAEAEALDLAAAVALGLGQEDVAVVHP